MIQFKSISLKHNDKKLFNDFNWQIHQSEKFLLQGKSGIGKTSLLKLLLGFQQPDSGSIFFGGLPISKETIRNIRSRIFYLSQDIDLKDETVSLLLNDILEANQIAPDDSQLSAYLRMLDLNKKMLDQKTGKLSGGERQRIGLLICFLLDRPVWLLDEPTSAIDDTMKKTVADYIIDQKKTMIIVSHDPIWQNYPINIKRGL